jgi:glyoxylase-like metal-dependent hydrolase (beta-lactamase superfamily II)
MPDDPARHLRVHEPQPGLFAYYDGRLPGQRFMEGPNWVDEGAIGLGIAAYALLSEGQALIYDTHVSPGHGAAIRAHLTALGARTFTIVYSHWHLDHVAGTAAFPGAEVIANARTEAHLRARRAAIEAGTLSGPPAIAPLVLPTRTFSGGLALQIGTQQVQLIEANIHSDDATVLWLPARRILLAGDTVEDNVTYVDEPADLSGHLAGLDRLAALDPLRVLPGHGAERIIARGGYGPHIIAATQAYVRWLIGLAGDPGRAVVPLRAVIADPLRDGTLDWFAPYEAVHRQNVARVQAHYRQAARG